MLSERHQKYRDLLGQLESVAEEFITQRYEKQRDNILKGPKICFSKIVQDVAELITKESYGKLSSRFFEDLGLYSIPEEDRHYIIWMLMIHIVKRYVDGHARLLHIRDPKIVAEGYMLAKRTVKDILMISIPDEIRIKIFDDVTNDTTINENEDSSINQ